MAASTSDPLSRSLFQRAARNFAAHGAKSPLGLLLQPVRRQALESALSRYQPEARALAADLYRGDADARRALAEIASRALASMRHEVSRRTETSRMRRWAASLDARWRDTPSTEYLDDPSLDQAVRVRILENLDAMNDYLGFYSAFFKQLLPFTSKARPTRVLDLAAGHAGFALAIAKLASKTDRELQVFASDIRQEYLALGEKRADAELLGVEFLLQDALDLSNLEPGAFDVVVCTQSLHHFEPGEVAVMFEEAARVAAHGVLFIDGARSALNAAMVAGFQLFRYRDAALIHDTLVSFRRFFLPEELELLSRLTHFGDQARSRWIAPGHCVLELKKSAASDSRHSLR